MGVQRPNSTNYVHPDEPNLLNLHKALQYNDSGEPELRTHVHGITLNSGDIIVDKVRVEVDGSHNTISADHPVPVYFPSTQTVTIQDGGNTITVDGNVSADVTGTVSLSAGTLEALETITVNQGTAGSSAWKVDIGSNGTVGITGEVEIKNDLNNPLPISKDTSVNSASNRIYVSQETDVVLADSNYELNLARGLVDSQYCEMKNGYAPSLTTAGGTVWGLNSYYPWSAWSTPSRLWVASSDPADVGQHVYIDGLDSNFARINSTVTLNGTTAVQTAETFYRVNRVYQLTGTVAAGGVSVRVTSSVGTEVGYMLPGGGRQKSGFFTVPAGWTAYILYGDCSSYKNGSGNVSGEVRMITRTNVDSTVMPFLNQFAAVVANGQYRNDFNVPLRIPEKTDIDVRFIPSGNQTTVSVNWEMIMIPN